MTIIEHAEKYLGKIDRGWKDNNSEEHLQVVSFKDSPTERVSTFLSLGLSDHIFALNEGKNVRQELVLSVYSIDISGFIVSLLMSLCEAILNRGKAVLRGEVIPLSADIAERIGFSAVYCTIPILFDDNFCTYDDSLPSTVMVWTIPIHISEANYIGANGWERFEDLMEAKDPDLCSLAREPVV